MSEHSEIQWTDHTFNGWSGCEKVSDGCKFCYAAAAPPSMRRGAEWGPDKERVLASDSYWDQPLAWYKAALKAPARHKVFAHSMSDVFEDRDDLDDWRDRLLVLTQFTRGTPAGGGLDWLLLTKRLDKALRYLSDPGLYDRLLVAARWWRERHPELYSSPVDNPRQESFHVWYPNVWIGASVENQDATRRLEILRQINARVIFASCEPLLGPLDIRAHLPRFDHCPEERAFEAMPESQRALGDETGCQGCPGNGRGECAAVMTRGLDWVIVGGESGRGRATRPMHPDWARDIRDQCAAAGTAFFFKQWGEYVEVNGPERDPTTGGHVEIEPSEEPEKFTNGLSIGISPDGEVVRSIQTMRPHVPYRHMHRLGVKKTGRELDGRTHDEFPAPR